MNIFKNIGVLVPVRLNSERLKKKSLKKIGNETLLESLILRLIHSQYIHRENIILCSTKHKSEDNLENIA